ncbi:MAG: DsbA family protein [Candidatus Paceibacteria bacterium]
MRKNTLNKGSASITVSIIIAVTIIAVTLIIVGADNSGSQGNHSLVASAGNSDSKTINNFRLPDENDHIRGNLDAPVIIVEFSDFECPFCSRLHPTLKRITDESPEKVSWVYRHFPLTTIHSRARSAAIASECVAKLGGNDSFWQFTDELFNNQRSLGNKFYAETASNLGIEKEAFNACLKDRKIANEVDADLKEATRSGGRGTPFSVAISDSGEMIPFSGALSYEQISAIVDGLIES